MLLLVLFCQQECCDTNLHGRVCLPAPPPVWFIVCLSCCMGTRSRLGRSQSILQCSAGESLWACLVACTTPGLVYCLCIAWHRHARSRLGQSQYAVPENLYGHIWLLAPPPVRPAKCKNRVFGCLHHPRSQIGCFSRARPTHCSQHPWACPGKCSNRQFL